MSFFSQFPKINFDVLGDGVENKIIDIFRNVDVRDFKIDDLVTYTYYEIKDGERPDQVSQKLYGDPQYYWTFFTVNDSLKGGLKDWSMSYNQLDNFIKNKYNSYSVITLKPKQYFDDNDGSFLGYLNGGDSFNSIAGLDIYSDPNIKIQLDNGKVLKPFLYDHDNYQLWVENGGDEFISSAGSFKIVHDGNKNQWIKNVFEPWLQTYNPSIISGETTASTAFDGSLNIFLIEKFVPIASEAPKKYIDPDTGEENCAYGVIINEGQGDIDSFISYRQDEESKNFEKSKIRVIRAQQIGRFVETFKQLLNN